LKANQDLRISLNLVIEEPSKARYLGAVVALWTVRSCTVSGPGFKPVGYYLVHLNRYLALRQYGKIVSY